MADKIKFKPPQGVVPETVQEDQHFDLVCTFRVEGSEVCLVQMGDVKMPGYLEHDEKEGKKPKYGDYARMMGPMDNQTQTPTQSY